MYIGIDLGTSAVKIALVDHFQDIVASTEHAFATNRPMPGWAEQVPEDWFRCVAAGLDELAFRHRDQMAQVASIGLAGQMHGVVLLDRNNAPVRPAMLWNDSRAAAEAAELNETHPELGDIVGVKAMPGFTGPKLLWLSRNDPESLARACYLLFPKDYVRFKLCGNRSTDVSDAAGSWLLDQKRRTWSHQAIQVCQAENLILPEIHESAQPTGILDSELAKRWGLPGGVVIAAGAGDVAAGCIGMGIIDSRHGLVSLGTSAQVVVPSSSFRPHTEKLVHTFCHALPNTWFHMAALLNGTSVLDALSRWTGIVDVSSMISSVESRFDGPGELLALPYFSGERTPHNDSKIKGAVIGLTHSSTTEDIALAFIESLAFSLADGLEALAQGAEQPKELVLIGGGSKSPFLADLIASVLNITIVKHSGAELGPALGAARLARISVNHGTAESIITRLPVLRTFEPDPNLQKKYEGRLKDFRNLYRALRVDFGNGRA
jgi:xylulokinase